MQAPVLAVGDGAIGLWAALRDVFPAPPKVTAGAARLVAAAAPTTAAERPG